MFSVIKFKKLAKKTDFYEYNLETSLWDRIISGVTNEYNLETSLWYHCISGVKYEYN